MTQKEQIPFFPQNSQHTKKSHNVFYYILNADLGQVDPISVGF